MQSDIKNEAKCKWVNIGESLNFSVECLNNRGFVNLKKISKRYDVPMASVLKKCVFCGKEIELN